MASIDRRPGGKWRAQVRREGHALSKTFVSKADAQTWVRERESAIDRGEDPSVGQRHLDGTFGSLIEQHIDDLATYGKRLRRSKESALTRLQRELGDQSLAQFTRERLIEYGRKRAREGAGPATLAIDFSFIGTVLTHASAMHGVTVDSESVRLARVALVRMGAIGKPQERDRRPTEE